MSKYRKPMKKSHSKKLFRRGMRTQKLNTYQTPSRGGIRL